MHVADVLAMANDVRPVTSEVTAAGVAIRVQPGPLAVTVKCVMGGRPATEKFELILPCPATAGTAGVSDAVFGLTVTPPDPGTPDPPGLGVVPTVDVTTQTLLMFTVPVPHVIDGGDGRCLW